MDSSRNKASIRRMRAEDADSIKIIYDDIVQKETTTEDFRRLVQAELSRGEDSACFVSELDGKIVGFMISYVLTFGFGVEKSAWLATLGVHPNYMGHGIGADLAAKIFQFYASRGIKNIYTSVQWDSTDLLSFFKTQGFTRSDFINLTRTL